MQSGAGDGLAAAAAPCPLPSACPPLSPTRAPPPVRDAPPQPSRAAAAQKAVKGSAMDRPDFECFVIILELSFAKLKLPEKFAEWLKGRDPCEMKLREADAGLDSSFNVEVVRNGDEVVYLVRGWKQFASSYSLGMGYFLLLSYDGVNMLTVKVFDPTMCRKLYQHDNTARDIVLDQFCVIPKGVSLDGRQVATVKNRCAQNQPKIPFYVCRIVKSHIAKAKGKMYFNQEYTKTHLTSFLTSAGTIDVKIYDNNNEEIGDFTMKIGENMKATITQKWLTVTKGQNWEVDDMVLFWFRRHGDNSLRLDVTKI